MADEFSPLAGAGEFAVAGDASRTIGGDDDRGEDSAAGVEAADGMVDLFLCAGVLREFDRA